MMMIEEPAVPAADGGRACDDAFTERDHAMVEYALRWVNHGGGPDQGIHTQFDTSVQEFYRGVVEILDRDSGGAFSRFGLSPVMVTRIKAVARRRIWMSS
ncbi:DUF3263 domain-containing protein [Rhodococcus sp. 14-2470-1b]|uniref:DUF3263 domain-containing protein n=1 Tax=Rhodococcus sp. 14-2470-1b TaxID=2023149 RepID=UPI001595FBF1|nr:DUF3263 domain-containing protein [Rhodococcus sp. 14-2470-1b]